VYRDLAGSAARPHTKREVRLERLMVLTGGVIPQERWQLKGVKFIPPSDNAVLLEVEYVDVVFTDVGLLVLAYSRCLLHETLGTVATGVAFGALGILAAGAMDFAEIANAKRKYRKAALSEQSLGVVERYILRGRFFAADEMCEIESVAGEGEEVAGLTFLCREKTYTLALAQNGHAEASRIKQWHREAAARRSNLGGASRYAGLHSLLEWAQRPAPSTAEWVDDAIVRANSGEGLLIYEEDLSGDSTVSRLVRRLRERGSAAALALARRLVFTRNRRAMVATVFGAVLSVIGTLLLWFAWFRPRGDARMAALNGAGIILIIGLLPLAYGLFQRKKWGRQS